jgi:hypothetical protein
MQPLRLTAGRCVCPSAMLQQGQQVIRGLLMYSCQALTVLVAVWQLLRSGLLTFQLHVFACCVVAVAQPFLLSLHYCCCCCLQDLRWGDDERDVGHSRNW